MDWPQQFEIIYKIFSTRLLENDQRASLTNIAKLLDIPFHKLQSWQKGQKPVREDLVKLAREHGFNCDWLLLGIGKPLQEPLDNPPDPGHVNICDTFHDMVPQIQASKEDIAQTGGMTLTDLQDIMNTQRLPPADAIAKWIVSYRINANFLLAQIGQPFLTEKQYNEKGPLTYVREKRGDFQEAQNLDREIAYLKEIDDLKKALEEAHKNMGIVSLDATKTNLERRKLQDKVNAHETEKSALMEKIHNLELENSGLHAKIAELENQRVTMKQELDNLKKDNPKAAGQE